MAVLKLLGFVIIAEACGFGFWRLGQSRNQLGYLLAGRAYQLMGITLLTLGSWAIWKLIFILLHQN